MLTLLYEILTMEGGEPKVIKNEEGGRIGAAIT